MNQPEWLLGRRRFRSIRRPMGIGSGGMIGTCTHRSVAGGGRPDRAWGAQIAASNGARWWSGSIPHYSRVAGRSPADLGWTASMGGLRERPASVGWSNTR